MIEQLACASSLSEVADEVRNFYDRYPYPPPVDSLDPYRRQWNDVDRRRADHHLFWPEIAYRDDHSILIAGCGTSQAAKHALRWPNAHVTGIDVSSTSVRHTEELKEKYNLTNLEVRELPLDRVEELGQSFDQIVSTGVLHHLPNPGAGLAALRGVLKPSGAMHLMVYAPYGRAGVYMLQDFCRRVGIAATEDGIENLILALQMLPPGHPLQNLLNEAPDFADRAALADALLHPMDRAYSVPRLFDFMDAAQLTFGRWIKQAPYLSHCGVMSKIPQSTRLAELSPPEQYAAVELFRGTMTRHSFVVYRKDAPRAMGRVDFTGDEWLRYVPIRMSDTICIRERVPPGSVGVLINRTHTYRDIILTLDSTEMSLFESIDGIRMIGELLNSTLTSSRQSHPERSLAFFERLWWHDQVVFDTSCAT